MNHRKGRLIAVGSILLGALVSDAVAPMGAVSPVGAKALSAQETPDVRSPMNARDAEAMFLEARRAVNAEDFDRASDLFAAIRMSRLTDGLYVPDAYYWEAFARYRQGDLEEARLLLETVKGGHEEAQGGGRLYSDVRNLHLEIRSQLAGRGDADETAELLREAEQALDVESGFAMMVVPVAVADLAAPGDSLLTAVAPEAGALLLDETLSATAGGVVFEAQQAVPDHEYAGQLADYVGQLAEYDRHVAEYDWESEHGPQMHQDADRAQAQEACEDISVQLAALEALMRFDVNRLRILRGVLERKDECSMQLHDEVVELIGNEEGREAEAVLLGLAGDHPYALVRRAAVAELWRFNSIDSYLMLKSRASAADDAIRRAAVDGLGRSRFWATSPEWLRSRLEDVATDEDAPLRLRRLAVYGLRRREEVEVHHLISLYELLGLDDSDDSEDSEDIREYLVDQLGYRVRAGDAESAEWAYVLALDPFASEGVRKAAFGAWTRAPTASLPALAQLYRDFTEPYMRQHAIYAISQRAVSDPQAALTMIDLIRQETNAEVRERGIYWLGRTGAEEAVDFLLEFVPTTVTDTIPLPPDGDGRW